MECGNLYAERRVSTYEIQQTVSGCDSIVTLDLTINGSGAGALTTLVACDSAVWNSITYDSSGAYVDTLQSIADVIV